MKFLKEHGYGGVIIWSFDLDDKTGSVCNEGPFPLFNAAKRELLNLPEHLSNLEKKCHNDSDVWTLENLRASSSALTSSLLVYLVLLCTF